MPIYEQIPVRLKLSLASNPPAYPIDSNTGNLPRFWRSQTVKLNLGLFDAFDAPVDISNLDYLQVHLFRSANDLVPLVSKTVTNTDPSWRPLITDTGWQQGTQQNVSITLDAADTDQGLYGANYASFWLVVQGKTDEDVVLSYAAGPCVIYNAASSLPIGPTNYVSFGALEQSAGDSTITPLSMQHLEVVTVIGDAGTRRVAIGANGLVDGAIVTMLVHLPATADITVAFYSIDFDESPIFTLSSNAGVNRALLRAYYHDGEIKPLEAVYPAY